MRPGSCASAEHEHALPFRLCSLPTDRQVDDRSEAGGWDRRRCGADPEVQAWKVPAAMTRDRYRPVGAFAPDGPVASLAVKCPRMVIRNTLMRADPGE